MIKRKDLSSVVGRPLHTQWNDKTQSLELLNDQGRKVAVIPVDGLFDGEGNYFHRDL